MSLKLISAPTIEPITLTQIKEFLRLDSGTLADNLTPVQSIPPGSHAIAVSYSLTGTAVEVLEYNSIVLLDAGTNGTGGTVDVKLQHRDDVADVWEDVTSGAFAQVTTANDNTIYEKQYTGGKRWLRVVSTVAGAACEFGVSIIKEAPTSDEDDLLTALIITAREYCEGLQNRAYITQIWQLWLDDWPCGDYIRVPLPPLQDINSIKYYDTTNTEAIMDEDDYFIDDKSEPGRVVLAYGSTWPTTTLRPANAVCVEFVAGYGDSAADIPAKVIQAIKLKAKTDYEYLTPDEVKLYQKTIERLLWLDRIVPV